MTPPKNDQGEETLHLRCYLLSSMAGLRADLIMLDGWWFWCSATELIPEPGEKHGPFKTPGQAMDDFAKYYGIIQ